MNTKLIRTTTKEALQMKVIEEKSKGSMILRQGCEKWHRLPYFLRVAR